MPDDLHERLAPVFRRHPEIELALLFGSTARGEAREDSDLDITVDGEDWNLLELTAELSLAAGRDVDLVDLRGAGYPLLKALLRDSLVLHEGSRGAAARWRSGAITRVELDRSWYERMRNGFLERLAEEAAGG